MRGTVPKKGGYPNVFYHEYRSLARTRTVERCRLITSSWPHPSNGNERVDGVHGIVNDAWALFPMRNVP